MPSPVRTDRTDCGCGARIILASGVPPLDYNPDPAGTFAAKHASSGAWQARPYLPGLVLAPLEKRHRVHRCETP